MTALPLNLLGGADDLSTNHREEPGSKRAFVRIILKAMHRTSQVPQHILSDVRSIITIDPAAQGESKNERLIDLNKLSPGILVVTVTHSQKERRASDVFLGHLEAL